MGTHQIKHKAQSPDRAVYAARIDVTNTPYRSYCFSVGPFETQHEAEAALREAVAEHKGNGVLYAAVVRATFWHGEIESGCEINSMPPMIDNGRATTKVYFSPHRWQGDAPEDLRYAPY